jgi:hypothetical protein
MFFEYLIAFMLLNFGVLFTYLTIVVQEEERLQARIPLVWEEGFNPRAPFTPIDGEKREK